MTPRLGLPSRFPSLSSLSPRARTLLVCAVPLVVLILVVALAPLPISLAQPGLTADVLGQNQGKPVVTVTGEGGGSGAARAKSSGGSGKLLMTTIAATPPDATVRLGDVVHGWFAKDRAVMPKDAVYPGGGSTKDVEAHNRAQMKQSQNAAVQAALRRLHMSPAKVKVTLRLADVGGPSAGLLFSLGVIEKVESGRGGAGAGDGGLTGGRTVAGTGTIDAAGKVGAVGGVPLKTQAAKRDGARYFLVPKAECADATAQLPKGLRVVPVTTLRGALGELRALRHGGRLARC